MISVIIAAHGGIEWRDCIYDRAYPSTIGQGDHLAEVVVSYQEQATLAEVRNDGAKAAKGTWLVFLDADDELAPGYIEAMAVSASNHWTEPHQALWVPQVQYMHRCQPVGSPAVPNSGRWPDLNVGVIGTLISRQLFLDLGGFRELPSLEDYDLWLRAAKTGCGLMVADKAVYIAHLSEQGRNRDQSVYWRLREEHHEVWEMAGRGCC